MSAATKERMETRQADFKRGIDGEEARRVRQDNNLSIRKNKREDKLAKRRQQNSSTTSAMTQEQQQQLSASSKAPSEMQAWIAKLNANNFEEVFSATVHFRKLLSLEKNPPIQQVIDAGIIPKLVQLCTATEYPKLQYEAAWALTNIASGTSAQTLAVIQANAVPVFVQLLRSPDENVREQAVWAIGNIAGDSPANRDGVLKTGALPALVENLRHTSKNSMLRNGTWTLSNMVRGKPQPSFELVQHAVAPLSHLIKSTDEEVLTDACWALSYLSDGGDDRMEAVVRAGVLPRLTELLTHSNASIQTPALRTIGNIATGNDQLTDAVVHAGAVKHLVTLVSTTHRKGIRKEACWTLSNITAGSRSQIQAVIDAGGVPELVRQLRDGEWEVKKEAAWAVSNYCSGGTKEQIRHLVQKNGIKPICDLLEKKIDSKIIIVALEAIKHILSAGKSDGSSKFGNTVNQYADMVEDVEGLDKIEVLQEHSNQKVYDKALEIIEVYFSEEENENFGGLGGGQQNGAFVFDGGNMGSFGAAPAFSFNNQQQQQQQQQQQGAFGFGGNGGQQAGFSF